MQGLYKHVSAWKFSHRAHIRVVMDSKAYIGVELETFVIHQLLLSWGWGWGWGWGYQ